MRPTSQGKAVPASVRRAAGTRPMAASAKCVGRVPGSQTKSVPSGPPQSAHGTYKKVPKFRQCGRRAEAFVLIRYSELWPHRALEGKHEDVLDLCGQCWVRLGPQGHRVLNRDSRFVSPDEHMYLRGRVGSWERLEGYSPPAPRDARKAEQMLSHKASIKRMMSQHNSRSISPEDWRKVMEAALDEHVVEATLRS